MQKKPVRSSKSLAGLIAVSALGYFVDVYDLLLFSVVRKKSLLDLGVVDADTLSTGLLLLNWQMVGLLVGGFIWGILGDKRGRLSVLFGSILLYSGANIANAFVVTVWQYEALRLVAGLGLAGELGAGIAIVSESMSSKNRGLGTMVVASVGLLGAIAAGWIGTAFSWRTAYLIGGIMGLVLLLLRIGVYESGLYDSLRHSEVARGSLALLFQSKERSVRFLKCILAGLPTYFIVGVLITLAPEFGRAFSLPHLPAAGTAVSLGYAGLALGSVLCSALSQFLGSRRGAFMVFHLIGLAAILLYLFWPPPSLAGFYFRCFFAGLGVGYWTLIVTNASEQFGTNLRATVTTAVPNLVRGALIPISWTFGLAREPLGLINGAAVVGILCVVLAMLAVWWSKETFGRSLDFLENR